MDILAECELSPRRPTRIAVRDRADHLCGRLLERGVQTLNRSNRHRVNQRHPRRGSPDLDRNQSIVTLTLLSGEGASVLSFKGVRVRFLSIQLDARALTRRSRTRVDPS